MRTSIKIASFAVGLVAVFAAATAIGAAVGPVGATVAEEPHGGHEAVGPTADVAAELPGGLMVSQDGYTLDLITRQLPATSRSSLVKLRILGPDGMPVTEYATEHGEELHLIAARRDLTGFQHVHPQLDASGTWSVTLNTVVPGAYRIFADFRPADREDGLTLGSDLAVAGVYDPQPFPPDSRVTVGDYTVDLQGELVPGTDSKLTLSVSKAGAPVTDLDSYLEAYGHLVALRDGDLAYLHVHPGGSPGDGSTAPGPSIEFFANIPSPGRYRLFLDFSHRGVVRTAEFTVTATYGAAGPSVTAPPAATPAPATQAPSPKPSTTRVPSDAESKDHDDDHG